mmetsp:Transcript_52995/g.113710  ORF Transcript_52995/g.113710 Transcript_52995/m.113710 type:complete len:243 (+) Transcript_52995:1229-1957(+)
MRLHARVPLLLGPKASGQWYQWTGISAREAPCGCLGDDLKGRRVEHVGSRISLPRHEHDNLVAGSIAMAEGEGVGETARRLTCGHACDACARALDLRGRLCARDLHQGHVANFRVVQVCRRRWHRRDLQGGQRESVLLGFVHVRHQPHKLLRRRDRHQSSRGRAQEEASLPWTYNVGVHLHHRDDALLADGVVEGHSGWHYHLARSASDAALPSALHRSLGCPLDLGDGGDGHLRRPVVDRE